MLRAEVSLSARTRRSAWSLSPLSAALLALGGGAATASEPHRALLLRQLQALQLCTSKLLCIMFFLQLPCHADFQAFLARCV